MTSAALVAGRVLRRLSSSIPRNGVRKEFSTLLTVAEEYPGLPATFPEPSKASSPSVTTLENGVIVVTEGASSSSTVSLTHPKAGSSNEMLDERGAAFVNECLNFRSGSGVSTLMIMRSIEDDGGIPFSFASRTGTTLGYTVSPDKVSRCLPLLATDCNFEKWDVRDAKEVAEKKAEVAMGSVQVVLTEQIYGAAYGPQTSMGRPYYLNPSSTSTDSIIEFRGRNYGLNGAVLAATGISDHAAFCREVTEAFSESPVGGPSEVIPALYQGGELRVNVDSPYAHVALAFDASSCSPALKNVLKHCLNLAPTDISSFSVDDLVGVYGGGTEVASTVDSMCDTLTSLPSDDIISRAKAAAKAEGLLSLECADSKDLAAFMTKSVLDSGSASGAEIIASYDSITNQDVQKAFTAMLKTKPSLGAVGNTATVPFVGTIASRFS